MTHRERILAAMEFSGPDRAPIHHYIFPGAFLEHGDKLLDLLAKHPDDFNNAGPLANHKLSQQWAGPEQTIEWVDGWGTQWVRSSHYTSGEVVKPAIPEWDDCPDFRFPNQPAEEHYEKYAARVAELHPNEFVMVSGGGLFQHIQNLRGPEGFFLDIAEDRAELYELQERLVSHYIPILHRHLQAGADCANWGDDWGAQGAMLCSPDSWRRIFKPYYRRLFDVVLEHGRKIWVHSDGWILDILPDLIEMGATLVNPQHACMGTKRVGEIVGGKLCVRTDIDRQWIIPHGTPETIREAVAEAMDSFGRFNGGILLHGEIGPQVPFENIVALYEAFDELGRYS